MGRVQNIFMGKLSHPLRRKVNFLTCAETILNVFLTFAKNPVKKCLSIRTGALHPFPNIDGCKCTRCTCSAAAPVFHVTLEHLAVG